MIHRLVPLLEEHREPVYLLLRHLKALDRSILTWSEVNRQLRDFLAGDHAGALADTAVEEVFLHVQETVVDGDILYLAVRERVARWQYLQLHSEEMEARPVDASDYLQAKEFQMHNFNYTRSGWVRGLPIIPSIGVKASF